MANVNMRERIQRQNDEFVRCFNANDMDGIMVLYDTNCILTRPNEEIPYRGRTRVPRVMREMRQRATSCKLTADKVGPEPEPGTDGMVYELGNYIFTGADGAMCASGRYNVIWKKTGEELKLYFSERCFEDNVDQKYW